MGCTEFSGGTVAGRERTEAITWHLLIRVSFGKALEIDGLVEGSVGEFMLTGME
jgi:hypothetical protein